MVARCYGLCLSTRISNTRRSDKGLKLMKWIFLIVLFCSQVCCIIKTDPVSGPEGPAGPKGETGLQGKPGVPDDVALKSIQARLDVLEAEVDDKINLGIERAWITSLSALCREFGGTSPEAIAAVGRAGQEDMSGSGVCSTIVADLNLAGTIWQGGYVGECVTMGYGYNRGGGSLVLANAINLNYVPCSNTPAKTADNWASPAAEGLFVCCK